MNSDLADWFEREVLPHERSLVRYLNRVWFRRSDVPDLLQEVYVRTYEAAGVRRPVAVKSFLFATTRHLLTDRLRRSRVVSIEPVGDSDVLNVLVDELTPERSLNARQELKLLADAFTRLSTRCREVVWMRRVEELPQKEVARRLGISERTVETYLVRGMQQMVDALFTGDQDRELRVEQASETEAGKER